MNICMHVHAVPTISCTGSDKIWGISLGTRLFIVLQTFTEGSLKVVVALLYLSATMQSGLHLKHYSSRTVAAVLKLCACFWLRIYPSTKNEFWTHCSSRDMTLQKYVVYIFAFLHIMCDLLVDGHISHLAILPEIQTLNIAR